jgi:hypothetical protein
MFWCHYGFCDTLRFTTYELFGHENADKIYKNMKNNFFGFQEGAKLHNYGRTKGREQNCATTIFIINAVHVGVHV